MVMPVTIHSYDQDTDADDDGDVEPADDDDENCTDGGDWGNRDEHTIMSMLVMMMMYVVSARVGDSTFYGNDYPLIMMMVDADVDCDGYDGYDYVDVDDSDDDGNDYGRQWSWQTMVAMMNSWSL